MGDRVARRARIASVVAATSISLACGTNYAYSAWGPEFAHRMALSATQSNVLGVSGNMGMYAMGIPAGLLIDYKTPRWGVTVGAIALFCGYFPLYRAYVSGPGSVPLSALSFCSFLTGLGSCAAFSAAIKTSTFNWPDHRGTASAFPLSGFGLSAFFFATIASFAFGDNIGDFLLLLSLGTLGLALIALPFIRLIPTGPQYLAVPTDEARSSSARRDSSKARRRSSSSPPAATSGESIFTPVHLPSFIQDSRSADHNTLHDEESASMLSPPVSDMSPSRPRSRYRRSQQYLEITGLKMLPQIEFWQLFVMLGLLAGVGLMTINNIGNDVKALIRRWDPKATPGFFQQREQMHVSLLSLASFAGRLLSGVGSDFLVGHHASRFWCLVISAMVFVAAQGFAIRIHDPSLLFLVSGLTGLGYGALFGVFPALVADTFGVQGLSLNWGFMIFAPVVTGNVFNLFYGWVYDDHSHIINDGSKDCPDGIDCYQQAYFVTLGSSIAAVLIALWCVWYQRAKNRHLKRPDREA